MPSSIENINIIFSNDNGDINIDSRYIKSIDEEKLENSYGVFKKLVIEFNLVNDPDNYEINPLLFHENRISGITVNYSASPSVMYTKVKNKWDKDAETDFDYELKVLDTKNKQLHIVLSINVLLSKNVIKFKEDDVVIVDADAEDKPKYYAISSLVEEALIFKNNGKLKCQKINPRYLDAAAIVDSKRIELTKLSDGYQTLKEKDKLFLNEYFGEEYGESTEYLKKVEKKLLKNIRIATANRGCNIACIHAYKYRINKELGMFNILIEYVCGKTPNA